MRRSSTCCARRSPSAASSPRRRGRRARDERGRANERHSRFRRRDLRGGVRGLRRRRGCGRGYRHDRGDGRGAPMARAGRRGPWSRCVHRRRRELPQGNRAAQVGSDRGHGAQYAGRRHGPQVPHLLLHAHSAGRSRRRIRADLLRHAFREESASHRTRHLRAREGRHLAGRWLLGRSEFVPGTNSRPSASSA